MVGDGIQQSSSEIFEHDVDMLRVGAGGGSLPSVLKSRGDSGWELVEVVRLPAAEDEKTFESGEARILFRLALFWKRPNRTGRTRLAGNGSAGTS